MSSEKVARLLADFDRPDQQKARSRVVPFEHALLASAKPQGGPKAPPPKPAPPPEDDAYERGRADGYAAARADIEQQLESGRQALNAQIDEERQNFRNEAVAKIAADIAEVGNQLETKVAGVVARILEPLITSAMQKQAITSFVEQLSSIASDSRRPVLRITGPSDLLELVRGKLGVRAIAVELRAAPVAEVSVIVDDIMLESQVKLWTERLKFAVLA
jgi:flagellar biosynthesis/type III secretory pathway protein FliH